MRLSVRTVLIFLISVVLVLGYSFVILAPYAKSAPSRHFNLHVFYKAGPHAYEAPRHPRTILVPKGAMAAHKVYAANPGDVFTFSGATQGRFVVTAWIDTGKDRLYDRKIEVTGPDSGRTVFLDRRRAS